MDQPRPLSRTQRREAIIYAAEALFLERGFDRAPLAEVVRRLGGSLTTFCQLFGDKQGLLRAIAIRWRDEAMAHADTAPLGSGPSKASALTDFALNQRDLLRSPRSVALIRMLVSECLRDRDFAIQIYRDLHLPVIGRLSEILTEWTKTANARIDDPAAAAHLFMSLVSGDMMLNSREKPASCAGRVSARCIFE